MWKEYLDFSTVLPHVWHVIRSIVLGFLGGVTVTFWGMTLELLIGGGLGLAICLARFCLNVVKDEEDDKEEEEEEEKQEEDEDEGEDKEALHKLSK